MNLRHLSTLTRPLAELRTRAETLAPGLPAGLTLGVATAWAIAGSLGAGLKLQRVLLHPQRLPFARQLALALPEIGFAAAMASLCTLLAIGFVRLGLARTALTIAQLAAAVCVIVHMLAHGYFSASGQPLDYAMFAFSLARADERVGVVASEANWPLAGSVVAALLAIVIVPSWQWRRARRRTVAVSAGARPHPGWAALWLTGICVAGLALTGYSPARRIERAFARDPVTTLALGFVRAQLPDRRYRGQPSRLRKTGANDLRARDNAVLRNIVVIILESTRADATSTYSKFRTTPFLSRFAAESVLVERAYAVVPHTTKALVAILCGFEPVFTLSTVESQPGGLPGRCLPSLLAGRGYDTAFFQAPTGRFEDRRMLAENLGFAKFVSGNDVPPGGLERINYFGYEDAIVLNPSEQWLAARTGRPFMAAYLTSAAHHPYGVPKSHPTEKFTSKRTMNKYLNAIRYTDGVVERIVDQYRRRGLLESTVFVIVGDHGEAFGEHGLYFHDDVMFEETLRVPLLFRLPGAERAGTRIPGPVSELSIVPTLIGLAGFESRDSDYEQGNVFDHPRQEVLYAQCYRSDRCAAVLRDPYKMIHHGDERPAELYDLVKDPGEQADIADDHGERIERWSRELLDLRLSIHRTYSDSNARALSRFVSERAPPIPQPLVAQFGDYLSLRGFKLPPDRELQEFGKARVRFPMSYYYYVHKQIPAGFSLRVQMRGEGGSVTSQHKPMRGMWTLQDFPVHRYIEDAHRVSLPDRWDSPSLAICLSLIDDRGAPVPVTQPGRPTDTCVPITTVRVHGG